jgi:rhodanese-related sulfurtransferase
MKIIRVFMCLVLVSTVISGCNTVSDQSKKEKQYNTVEELLTATKASIQQITIQDLKQMIENEEELLIIDVRTTEEFEKGSIPGTIHLQRGVLEFNIEKESFWDKKGLAPPKKSDKVILYCRSGNRSALSAKSLEQLGFTDVYSLDGGFKAWNDAYPVSASTSKETADTTKATTTQPETDQ